MARRDRHYERLYSAASLWYWDLVARAREWTENVEMYLKYIYLLSQKNGGPAKTGEISRHLKVAPPSVTEMLDRLQQDGLARHRKYQGATLTKRGRDHAIRILRRHCTMEYFLAQALGVPEGRYHDEACAMEHALSDDTAKRLRTWIDQPSTCPDCYDLKKLHCRHLTSGTRRSRRGGRPRASR